MIRYCSMDDELDFFVDDDWAVVQLNISEKRSKRRATEWLERYGTGRIVIYNGAHRPTAGTKNWGDQLLGSGSYYFFFENKKTAAMFKVAHDV